jgi:hypothetical protein
MSFHKTAGAVIFLQEELSDARVRCEQLKGYIVKALNLINDSNARDHIYAVAGDAIAAVPETLLKIERALGAAAMAVNELDSADLRQVLRPAKIDELEKVLEDIRVKIPRRTGKADQVITKYDLTDYDYDGQP